MGVWNYVVVNLSEYGYFLFWMVYVVVFYCFVFSLCWVGWCILLLDGFRVLCKSEKFI